MPRKLFIGPKQNKSNEWRRRNWAEPALRESVAACYSAAAVLDAMKIDISGGNYQTLYKHIAKYGLDTSHWTGRGHLKGKTHGWSPQIPLEDILKEGTYYASNGLKKRLIKAGLLCGPCSVCGQGDVWNGKPLVLQLEHKNGEKTDNRLSNLCLICPNCHTQTSTFAGRNKGSEAKKYARDLDSAQGQNRTGMTLRSATFEAAVAT